MTDALNVDLTALIRYGDEVRSTGNEIVAAQRAHRSQPPVPVSSFGNSGSGAAVHEVAERALETAHTALDRLAEVLHGDAELLQLTAFSYHEASQWEGARHRPPPGRS
ncbi:hypothetical protein GCM10022225_11350 [Plantactinospora mayteni]|uniref:PE domain-containing protein n=1 Tax=Plantactinospora mayteni TaxID=566021 RepID=A0ABQ4EHA0_9ACTN|nr:hypothetical protein [Plantactinospora mayteni]GIG94113.1 hypothetical protein Pma05_06860 [Plantactinospora mayteni]